MGTRDAQDTVTSCTSSPAALAQVHLAAMVQFDRMGPGRWTWDGKLCGSGVAFKSIYTYIYTYIYLYNMLPWGKLTKLWSITKFNGNTHLKIF